MCTPYTAIIHLRNPTAPVVHAVIEPMLRMVRGVEEVHFEPAEATILVEFDNDETALADIVRMIEDYGSGVSSVAQRPGRQYGIV